jgi:hypothetical protein
MPSCLQELAIELESRLRTLKSTSKLRSLVGSEISYLQSLTIYVKLTRLFCTFLVTGKQSRANAAASTILNDIDIRYETVDFNASVVACEASG